MAIFCNQNQQGLARRPHKHKHEDGRNVNQTWSTRSRAKKSSLNPTKRLRITQRITQPRITQGIAQRIPAILDDLVEATSIFTEEDAKSQRNFRSKPFDVNRSRFNFVKQIDEISPIFINSSHQLQSSTPVIKTGREGRDEPRREGRDEPRREDAPRNGRPPWEEKRGDDDRYDSAAPLEDKGGEM